MIVIGIVLGQAFFLWTPARRRRGRRRCSSSRSSTRRQERAAVYAMFAVVALEAMLNFSVPLYIQIVQGRTPIATAIAMLPFNLTVFFTAMLVVRLYDRLTPRHIGRSASCSAPLALLWLAFVVRNDWSAVPVLIGLIAVRHRPGRARHAAVQRAGHRLAQGARGRRRLAARHHPEPRRRGRHGGRRARSWSAC